MKVLVFGSRDDEMQYFDIQNKNYNFEFTFIKGALTLDNIQMTKGYDAVWIVTICKITEEVAQKLKENDVKYIVSRAAGADHMDLLAIKECGLKASNVPFYSPNAISEHTVLLVLMALRHMKREMKMIDEQVFTLDGLKGRELRMMKVGVIGTGRIGIETVKILKGFGCEIMAYDTYPQESVEAYASYETIDTIFKESDVLIFHCPLTEHNYHMICKETISKLKKGVCLINTARGGLFDYAAVLDGLKEGQIGALAFDVYEYESVFLRKNFSNDKIQDEVFQELISMENVIYTSHMSFYTDKAVESMISVSLENLYEYDTTGQCKNELIK